MKKKEAMAIIAKRVAAMKQTIVKRHGQFNTDHIRPKHGSYLELHKRHTQDENIIEFQKRADDLFIASIIMQKNPKELQLYKSFRGFMEDTELSKAMDTATAAAGGDWIPTDFSRDLIDKVQVARQVAAAFPRVNMPTDPFKIPRKKSFSVAKKGTENTAPTATTVGTANVTLDATKMITLVEMSYELDEDAVLSMMDVIKEDIANSLGRGEEQATIDGDTQGTHQDSDVTDAEDVRKNFDGLRRIALANSYTRDLSTFNADTVNSLRGDMGIYGVLPSQLVWIVSPSVYSKLMVLRDAQNNNILITLDKVGNRATVITGSVGILFGSNVIVSEFLREDLNASGVHDGVTTTKTGMLIARRDGFIYGDRRKMLVEMDKDVTKQTHQLVASMRLDFKARYDATTERIVNYGINIAS